ncbi:MAG: chitobiase/beta-hexosaminidase C-terminal domain-containing protein [Planctomycetes bacterium]|nr:chitobiase/beta-hexosaminidase C-terminal domain-containing protein [Planctomycetota bacterium]
MKQYRRIGILFIMALCAAAFCRAGEGRPDAPTINPVGGDYAANATIRISIRAKPGATIIYTTDDSLPTLSNGTQTDTNLVFINLPPGDVVVRAVAYRPGQQVSRVSVAEFYRGRR